MAADPWDVFKDAPAGTAARDPWNAFKDAEPENTFARALKESATENLVKPLARGAYQARALANLAQGDFAEMAEMNRRAQEYAPDESTQAVQQQLQQAESVPAALGIYARNPGVALQVAAESAAVSVPSLLAAGGAGAAGGAVAGPVGSLVGAIAGMGLGSYATDYFATLNETAAARGVDMTDPAQLERIFTDKEFLADARSRAHKHALPVAAFDAISVGIAGRLARVVRRAPGFSGRAGVVAGGGAEIAGQAAAGAAGEAGGQIAAEGRITSPADVAAEAVGEIVPGIVETALTPAGRGQTTGPTRRASRQARQEFRQQLEQTTERPTPAQPQPEPTAAPEQAPAATQADPWAQFPDAPSNAQATPSAEVPADLTPVPQTPTEFDVSTARPLVAPQQQTAPAAPQGAAPPAPAPVVAKSKTGSPGLGRMRIYTPDETKDSALEFLSKGEGINGADARSMGIDPAYMRIRGGTAARAGGRMVFRRKGLTLDAAAEALAEAGYPVVDERGNYDPRLVVDVILKELAGTKVYSNKNQTWMDDVARRRDEDMQRQAEAELVEYTPRDNELAGLDPDNRDDAALVARAADIDEGAVESLARQYEDDDAGFMAAIRSFLDEQGPQTGGVRETGERPTQVREGKDLFGFDTGTQAGLSKKQQRVERKLGQGREAPTPEQAPRGDLFREAEERAAPKQADIEGVKEPVYHGSPHKFDRFELSDRTIGTGEGAQAYGHGLYFAEDPKVAGSYASDLGRRRYFLDGKEVTDSSDPSVLAAITADKGDVAAEIPRLRRQAKETGNAALDQIADHLERGSYPKLEAKAGNLYHVDIPDESIAQMLDWDAPLSEQPEAVRIARKFLQDHKLDSEFSRAAGVQDAAQAADHLLNKNADKSMAYLYFSLADAIGGDQAEVSKYFAKHGIPGIKYYDGGSRAAKQGTRNFVVFDDSILTITSVEEPKVAYKGRKVTLDDKQLSFNLEVRPGTTEAQVKAGNVFIGNLLAYRDRLRGATVLADGLTRDFVERGFVSLVGQTARNPNDLATLAQVYRDPRVETLRWILTDGDKIVAQTGVAQRLPGGVSFGRPAEDMAKHLRFLMKVYSADGYFMLHNHPSGRAIPSQADENVTKAFAPMVPGFRGHIVIDTNEFANISADGRVDYAPVIATENQYNPDRNPRRPHPWLGQPITGPEQLAGYAKALHAQLKSKGADTAVLIATDNKNRVRAMVEISHAALTAPQVSMTLTPRKIEISGTAQQKRQFWQLVARLRRLRAATGAGGHLLAVVDESVLPKMMESYQAELLSDVISTTGKAGSSMWRRTPRIFEPLETGARVREVAEEVEPYRTGQVTAPGTKIEVGGGEYTVNPFLGMPQDTTNLILEVMQIEEGRIAGERGGTEPVTWAETGSEADKLLKSSFGSVFNSLINRLPGSAANAKTLEAYARLVNTAGQAAWEAGKRYDKDPSTENLNRAIAAREQLGVALAPFMGYRTEAGRALNILRKIQADFADANAIFDALGDGSESAMRDFAKRMRKAKTVGEALRITKASYAPTLWDQYYEYWINSILSGPWTHVVNIASNGMFNTLEVGTELAVSLVSPNVSTRGALARISGQFSGLQLGLANGLKAFLTEQPQLTPRAQIEVGRQGAIPGWLGKLVRIPGRLLMAEDEVAKAIIYTGEIHRLAMEEALRRNPENPHAEFPAALREAPGRKDWHEQALKMADRGTFQTPLGDTGRHATVVLNKTKVGRVIVPFVRTPTNIFKRAIEYTPGAPIIQNTREDFKAGGRRRDIAAGRMVIGSTVMMGVMSLVAQGLITGAGPDDPAERRLWEREGRKPYSIRIPFTNKWVRYNRFEPLGMMVGVASDMYEIWRAMDKKEADELATMIVTSIALNLGDKTFLRGVVDFANAYSDPKRYLTRWADNLAASNIPNIAAQTARAIDPYAREARSMADTFRARIPVVREKLAPRHDIAGEKIPRSIVEPLASTEQRNDPLARTMLELGVFKNAPNRRITLEKRTIELTSDEYQSMVEYVQGTRWRMLTPMVQGKAFKRLRAANSLAAATELDRLYDKIGREARNAWLRKHPDVLRRLGATPMNQPVPSLYIEAR